jgi:tight adherence protein C
MDIPTLIMWALVGIGVLSAGGFAAQFFLSGSKAKRIKSVISQHRGDLSRRQLEGLNRPSAIRQQKSKPHVELVNKLLKVLNLQHVLLSDNVRNELAQAGLRGRGVVAAYMTTRILMAIGIGVGVLIFEGLMKKFPYPDFVKFIFAGIALVVGFYLPKLLLANTVQKRQDEMTLAFPDALDLLTICVEAGLGIEAAFARVTEEIANSSPILAQEFGLLSAELAFLGDRRQAYENFSKRTGLPSAKALSTALIQSEQYGTSVGVALRVLSQEKRDERMSAAEQKAAALPAKLTVPMIIFFLPVLFIVVIGPAAMQISNR